MLGLSISKPVCVETHNKWNSRCSKAMGSEMWCFKGIISFKMTSLVEASFHLGVSKEGGTFMGRGPVYLHIQFLYFIMAFFLLWGWLYSFLCWTYKARTTHSVEAQQLVALAPIYHSLFSEEINHSLFWAKVSLQALSATLQLPMNSFDISRDFTNRD